MIAKCPKCGSYTTGVIDRLLYAGICGRKSCDEIVNSGGTTANTVNKWTKNKFGKHIGGTIGAIGKGAVNAASIALGQGRALVHSVSSLMDAEDYYCFVCKNPRCKHEWIVAKKTASDKANDFFKLCLNTFLKYTGKKYLVINPEASVAYRIQGNTFMLPSLPHGISIPENSLNYGEIYVSHPASPNVFYSIETYRMKVLEDELNDLKQFLLKLGASSIYISGMSDSELENYSKSTLENRANGGNRVAKAEANAMAERENDEYRRLRSRFSSTIKGEIQNSPILDTRLFEKWCGINPEWDRILELRRGGITEYTFCIETEAITNAKKMELDKVSASYSEFDISVENDYSKKVISKLKESKRMSFTVEVVFHSLSQYKQPSIISE